MIDNSSLFMFTPTTIHRSHMYSKDNTPVKTSGRCITKLAKMSIHDTHLPDAQLTCLHCFFLNEIRTPVQFRGLGFWWDQAWVESGFPLGAGCQYVCVCLGPQNETPKKNSSWLMNGLSRKNYLAKAGSTRPHHFQLQLARRLENSV